MQLKMPNSFNTKLVQQIIHEEDQFLTDIFSKMPLPMSEHGEDEDHLFEDEVKPVKRAKLMPSSGNTSRAETFDELHKKLEALKGQKKLDHKQKLIKKGLKNRIKKKTKREERLAQKKMARTENAASGMRIKTEDVAETAPRIPRAKPVFNSDGNMVFSKFDFAEIGTKRKPPHSEKNPKKALEILKVKKEKLKELEEAGEKEKAQEIKEKDAWRTVLAKASGEKVKDDPELLKRTIKRTEQQKHKSAKKWDSRIEGVEKKKQEQQHKRQENILKRKKDKKTNKLKKASKKGRVIPGF